MSDPIGEALAAVESAVLALRKAYDGPVVQPPPPVHTPPVISTAADFDRALSAAAPGALIVLDPMLVYTVPLVLSKSVYLQAGGTPQRRVTPDDLMPSFTAGLTITGDDVTVCGVEVKNDITHAIVTIQGARTILDRCRVLGDPVKGARRGIDYTGNGDGRITRCHVDDCFGPYPGGDVQALYASDMAPGLVVDDNFFCGGTETVMLGGADSSTPDRMPSNITITHNTITKKPEWQGLPIGCKNTVEFKACRNVTLADNEISGSWGGHGQDGYLLMLTVRNQNGKAPWSTVQDVLIARNVFSNGAAAINVLGRDDRPGFVSLPMLNVVISENSFLGLDVAGKTGSAKMVQIGWGPDTLTIANNTFAGTGMTSAVYFQGPVPPPCNALHVTDNTWPKTRYRIFSSGGTNDGGATAWAKYVVNGVLLGNTETV